MDSKPIGYVSFKDDYVYCEANGDMEHIFDANVIYPFYDDRRESFWMKKKDGSTERVQFDSVDVAYLRYNDGTIYVRPKSSIQDDNGHLMFTTIGLYRVRYEDENEYVLVDARDVARKMSKHLFKIYSITGFDFNIYQKNAAKTAVYPKKRELEYLGFGLVGEAGEVANKLKKIFRDDDGKITEEKKKELAGEIGDILWYCSQLSSYLGYDFNKIAFDNLTKLRGRQAKGTLKGDGDKR